MSGPFYTALVDSTENTFNPTVHNREDWVVFQAKLDHSEGQKPTLSLTIQNPRLGLLRTGAHRYLWFSWFDGTTLQPLFFGRIVGLPSDLLGEKIQVDCLADPVNYLGQKQAIAETKKIKPYYDPIFLDDVHRDDPDSILEGWPELWHISRIALGSPNAVVTSHILDGEEGTVDFQQSEVPYDSVQMSTRTPKTLIHVEAKVSWNQKATGTIDFGSRMFSSLTGDGLLSDWPKPGAGLSGGWSVADASVSNPGNEGNAPSVSFSTSWQNKEKKHSDGDQMSLNVSYSVPAFAAGAAAGGFIGLGATITSYKYQPGFLDAFAVDDDGNYDPVNIPMSLEVSFSWAVNWAVSGTLVLQYDADRNRTETVTFDVISDVQEMVTSPDVPTTIEILQLNADSLDKGVLNILEWQTIAGKAVTVGTIVQVTASVSPLIPETNYQLCIVAGTASALGAEPTFSGTQGIQTVDNTVIWVSLGTNLNNSVADWVATSTYGEGAIIQPVSPSWLYYYQLYPSFPLATTGASISLGQVIKSGTVGLFFVCTTAGVARAPSGGVVSEPAWNVTRGATTLDGTAVWTCIGASLADGVTFWLQTHAPSGTTSTLRPAFGAAPVGTVINDGTAIWYSLGLQGNYIAPAISDSSRRSYFPTSRGLWSLEYCIQMATNHLMMSARCVTIEFDCLPTRIPSLNLRKNARLFDPRLPAGYCWGKITQYTLEADGSQGKVVGHVTMQCPIGKGNVISPVAGTADYIDSSYIDPTYYERQGAIVLLDSEAVGYTVPQDAADDDGLVFPLSRADVVITDAIEGDIATQQVAATRQIQDQANATQTGVATAGNIGQTSFAGGGVPPIGAIIGQQYNLQNTPLYWHLVLKPVAGLSFFAVYDITTTKLVLPMGINMEAT